MVTSDADIKRMNFSEFLMLAKDFTYYPDLLSRDELTIIFRACCPYRSGISEIVLKQFVTAIIHCASMALSKQPFTDLYTSTASRAEAFFACLDIGDIALLRQKTRKLLRSFTVGDGSSTKDTRTAIRKPSTDRSLQDRLISFPMEKDILDERRKERIQIDKERRKKEQRARQSTLQHSVLQSMQLVELAVKDSLWKDKVSKNKREHSFEATFTLDSQLYTPRRERTVSDNCVPSDVLYRRSSASSADFIDINRYVLYIFYIVNYRCF